MIEYFGTFNILIFTINDLDIKEKTSEENLEKCDNNINKLKEKKDWSTFDIIFFDAGNGILMILKDNTSKFSIQKSQIQG